MNKLNNSDNVETIRILLDEDESPVAFANKLKCLISGGFTESEARFEISMHPIELEMYYEVGSGLMAVEQGAVESGTIYSPYSGELYKDEDYIAPPTDKDRYHFYKNWGQTNEEICSCLGYDEEGSEDLLVDNYFWATEVSLWCNKEASGFTERDQEIADYLRK
jgi:hypothetical protein